jgi:hypothetical protein
MERSEIARILQNMIDEAEENVKNLEEAPFGRTVGVLQRRADIDEAMKLVEELGGAPLYTVEEWKKLDDKEAKLEALRRPLDPMENRGDLFSEGFNSALDKTLVILREAFPAPDAKEGQGERKRNVMDVIWRIAKALKGWDGSADNAGDKIVEAAKALRDFGYWQDKLPAAPSPEPEGEDLIEALAAIEKAQDEVSALCNGKRWIMSVPAREDEDSDLVIAAALHKAKQILARLSPPSPKEVPMAMIERLRYQGINTREWIIKAFADYGFSVKE